LPHMSPQEAVQEVITDDTWLKLCNKWTTRDGQTHFAGDLYGEFCLTMLEYDPKKIQSMLDNAKDMSHPLDLVRLCCFSVLNRMWNSSTSPFYRKYRKHFVIDRLSYEAEFLDEPIDIETFLVSYNKVKQDAPRLEVLMTRLYAELGSFRAIEREVGINHQTAFRYVRKFRDRFNSSDY